MSLVLACIIILLLAYWLSGVQKVEPDSIKTVQITKHVFISRRKHQQLQLFDKKIVH